MSAPTADEMNCCVLEHGYEWSLKLKGYLCGCFNNLGESLFFSSFIFIRWVYIKCKIMHMEFYVNIEFFKEVKYNLKVGST